MAHFSFITCVLTQTNKVVPGLDAPAFVLAWIWAAPVDVGRLVKNELKLTRAPFEESSIAPPVCNATCAQQQLSIAPPLSLKYDVNVQLLVVDEDVLHASMEAVQLGFTLPYCVIGLWTT